MAQGDDRTDGGWRIRELDARLHRDAVAALSMACADYAMLVNGEPPRPSDGEEFFRDAPPGRSSDIMLKLGVMDPEDRLVGLADVARAYPDADTWYVGLLLLHPSARGRGAGRAAVRRIDEAAAEAGAARLMLSVVEANRRALRFWRGLGFKVARRLPRRRFGAKEHARLEMARRVGGLQPGDALERFLDVEGRVTIYPAARKHKRAVLTYLADKFETGRQYTEREVNEVLTRHHTFGDWALLRRDMFDSNLLGRARDGSRYWRVTESAAARERPEDLTEP